MLKFMFGVALIAVGTSALAQIPVRNVPIMYGFVPDVSQLEMLDGEMLKTRVRGKTIAGIYGLTMHDDQRYTETLSADGALSYRERDFTSVGRWFVKGDKLCFAYTGARSALYCFYEFEYGSCTISFPDTTPLVNGKPVDPSDWTSVQIYVDADFKWPEDPSQEDALVCRFSTV